MRAGWHSIRSRYFSSRLVITLLLLTLLPLLAWLQYRWINQVSEAERQRAQASLQDSQNKLASEIDTEVTRAHFAFQLNGFDLSERSRAADLAEQLRLWTRLAPYPGLIASVYRIESEPDKSPVVERIRATGLAEAVPPSAPEYTDLVTAFERSPRKNMPPGFAVSAYTVGGQPALLLPVSAAIRAPPPPRSLPGQVTPSFGVISSSPHSSVVSLSANGAIKAFSFARSAWTVVVFDLSFLRGTFLPDALRRHFLSSGESEYEIAVIESESRRTVYSNTRLGPSPDVLSSPDATAVLFAFRPDCLMGDLVSANGAMRLRPFGPPRLLRPELDSSIFTRKASPCAPSSGTPMGPYGRWTLHAKHRSGSLDSAIAAFRRRSLTISFGVLLILGLGLVMLTISTERARSLARRQMEFAMGVSHELRTPITVIRLASENLADGIVENTEQARKYGQVIGGEARRLSGMVEQILTFARAAQPEKSCTFAPVAPTDLIEQALETCAPALLEAGMEVEKAMDADLPWINADANLLAYALQNLIVNAVKYAHTGGWIRIAVRAAGANVEISVEDRGLGIALSDLPHIFEPFYRGSDVRASQAPGIGMGLSLVKRAVEAHGGTVTAGNSGQPGACFTITLPTCAPPRTAHVLEEALS